MTGQPAGAAGGDALYFQAVEEHFVRLRGAPMVLSPDDWHLAASWQDRRIPLAVVLRGISRVFQRSAARGGRRGPIQALAYCRHGVEEEFGRHLAAAVGAGPRDEAGTGARAPERLRQQAGRLAAALARWPDEARALAREIVSSLEQMARDPMDPVPLEEAEARLASMEDALLACLQESLPDDERRTLARACEARLAGHRTRMTEEVYQRTCRHALRGEIRRRLQVPRLSLLSD